MSRRGRRRKRKNNSLIFVIIILLIIGLAVYYYINKDTKKEVNITNNIEEKNEKKNYDFNGKSISCDNLIKKGNEAIYINDGDIYYITYNNGIFSEHKLVSKGTGIGEVDNTLVGHINKDSKIDTNYAKKIDGKDYVVYINNTKKETTTNNTDTNSNNNTTTTTNNSDYFKDYEKESELVLRGGGYAGANNKAVSLKNGVAYFLRFDGDNLVSSEKIATNVKKIANIGDSHDKIIVVYIESNTILEDNYKDYEIMEDDDGKKCIKIC